MINPTGNARFLPLALALLSMVARAQTTPAVTVTARGERRVALTVHGEDHTYTGDYKVDVYLPAGYAAGSERYRVLYLFDGNDVHREHDDLLGDGLINPAILVAIQNRSAQARFFDLTPSPDRTYQAPTGGLELFGQADRQPGSNLTSMGNFRTLPDAAHTGVAGNSLGGLAACYLGYAEPQVFGHGGVHGAVAMVEQRRVAQADAARFVAQNRDAILDHGRRRERHAHVAKRQARRPWPCCSAAGAKARTWRSLQVHNMPHGWESAKTQLRDMLHFLLPQGPGAGYSAPN